MSFIPNRSLLNPKFEGYKFNPLDQETLTKRCGLPYRPKQTTVSTKQFMTFQEVQSRISHNHLVPGEDAEVAFYVDAEHRVISLTLVPDTLQPSFKVLLDLPKQIQSSAAAEQDSLRPEYPSIATIDSRTLLVSDGHGMMYILALSENMVSAEVVASYELRDPSAPSSLPVPFRIHQCAKTSSTTIIAILSSKYYGEQSSALKQKLQFDVWGTQLLFPIEQVESTRPLDIQWRRRGDEVPMYTKYNGNHDIFLLFGGSPYAPLNSSPAPSYTPTPDEIAPIPRRDENLDSTPKPPPPYSWTQTSDSITMAFPLPSTTQKSDIKVTFTSRTLTVLISGPRQSTPLPRYSLRTLWDSILPSTSFWTWDREGEKSVGLLTLHIDKQHEGTRWSQVFATNHELPEPEVAETLDPSELYNIKEALEKYTSAALSGDSSGFGLGSGVSSLGKGEMDEEVDASIGKSVYLTRVSVNAEQQEQTQVPPQTILSTPLPGITDTEPSLIIKNGIDGLLCSLNTQDEVWTHESTFSALAFVLASKQDTRFTFHISSRYVLAFESGSKGLGSNIYIYEGSPSKTSLWAKQFVVRIGDSSSGPLLGISAVKVGNENKQTVILCLCEHELILLRATLM